MNRLALAAMLFGITASLGAQGANGKPLGYRSDTTTFATLNDAVKHAAALLKRPDSLGTSDVTIGAPVMRGDTAIVDVVHRYRAGCPPRARSDTGRTPYQTPLGSTGATEYRWYFVQEGARWRWAIRQPRGFSDGSTTCT